MKYNYDPSVPFSESRKPSKPVMQLTPYEKEIEQIKFVIQNSPSNDRWDNIWLDMNALEASDLLSLRESLERAGLSYTSDIDKIRGNADIPRAIDVHLNNALQTGLTDPVWGQTLTNVKAARESLARLKIASYDDSVRSGSSITLAVTDKEISSSSMEKKGSVSFSKEIDKITTDLSRMSLGSSRSSAMDIDVPPPPKRQTVSRKAHSKSL